MKVSKRGWALSGLGGLGIFGGLVYAFGWNPWKILWLFAVLVLGALFGVPLGLAYPFSPEGKALYILGLVVAVGLVAMGIWKRTTWWGRALMVAGALLWTWHGVVGLGTAA